MAMINDKGPEESRDTDATYIILSHQSMHLPGPSRQRGWEEVEEKGEEVVVEVRVREGETERMKREREGERVIYSQSFAHRNCFSLFSWGKVKKKKKKNK